MSTDDAAEGCAMSLLQTNEAVLAKLVRESPVAIIVIALADGHVLDVNDRFLELFGYTRDEVIGQTSVEFGLWADPLQRAELMSALVIEHPLREFEAMVRTKSGAECQVLATVEQVTIDDRACLLTQMYDVTAYRQVEPRFRALVEQLPVITYTHGLGEPLTVTYISPQVETVLGYTPDEVLAGQPEFLESRTHPEDQKRVREEIERTLRTLSPFHAEYRLQARDGHWVWVQDKATVVHDAQGQPLLWQGVIADVSAQRRAEAAREAAEARYSALFAQSLDAVLLTAPDGRILDANSQACRIFGHTVEELRRVGRAGVVDQADPRLAAALAERARTGRFRGEITMKRWDGELFPAEVSMQDIEEPSGELWSSMTIRDLTSQRQAEAALRESEERFRALVQNSYDVITIVDPDGTRRYASPSIERQLGYRPSDLVGRSAMEFVHPDDAPRLQDAIESCLRGAKETSVLELRFHHRDGSWRDFTAIGTNLLQEPSVAGIVFNSRDITARKAAERALQASEARLAKAQEIACLGSWEWGIDDESVLWSNQLFRIFGLPLGTLARSKEEFFAIIHPADREMVSAAIERALLSAEPFTFEHRAILPQGEVRIFHVRGEVAVGDNGRPLRIYGTSQDITERVQAEEALRQSEDRFRSAFDYAPIGKSLIAQDGRYLQVNRALCELIGYSEEELLGKTFHDITYPEDLADHLELHKRLWAGDIDNYQMEKRYLRKDSRVVWIHLTGSIVRDADGPKYAIAQVLDISDRRRVDMDRAIMLASEREYTRQLRALTEMRADLTAMIAHELRAPVAALRMMTFLLSKGELSSQAEGEMFAAVDGEIEQLDRLINDVADVTTAEREDFSVQLNPIPLNVLFENAAAFGRATLGANPFTVAPAPDVRVWCDAERISQVLRNLLDNATKHTPPGTAVELRAHGEGARVRIEVADRGPGLPAEDVASIFEKFGRGHQAAARQTPGAGLGLYLSRQIVRAHGAELTVASAPGGETIFAFDLETAP